MQQSIIRITIHASMIFVWIGIIAFFIYTPPFALSTQKSLNIFTWPGTLDSVYLKQFENKTGITLHITYYESNQELLAKLEATGGADYDIIVPSDYMVDQLIKKQLIKKLDKTKLPFFKKIRPEIKNIYYDPSNQYSVPFFWSMYGLGINTHLLSTDTITISWDLIFNPAKPVSPIGMTNYPREAIMIAAQYLFGSADALKQPTNIAAVQLLLQNQKQYVYAYTDDRAKELLISEAVSVAVAQGADIIRIQKEYPHIQFFIPQEGGFAYIESIVIPKKTKKDDLIYSFINFLFEPDVLEHHVNQFGFCPPLALASHASHSCNDPLLIKQLEFFVPVISTSTINDIWLTVMTK